MALTHLALAVASLLGPAAQAAPAPYLPRQSRFALPSSLGLDLPDFVPAPRSGGEDVPRFEALNEVHSLVEVDNDNDAKRSRLSVRLDAAGLLSRLEKLGITDPGDGRAWDFSPAWTRCNARGADRIDRRKQCGVEMEHARGDTSAIRLYSPDLDRRTGGTFQMIYLKHYAIFGSHKVDVLTLRIRKENGTWGLFVPTGEGERRVSGLFIHRGSRGIGSITACLKAACPSDWARRGRENNENLPPIWDPAYYWRWAQKR